MIGLIELPLTKGYVSLIDPIDTDLACLKWYASVGHRVYAARNSKDRPRRCVLLHRVVLERVLGRSLLKGEYPDHIDNNSLNNCRGNLRLATASQNAANSKRRSDNSSGYKGVSYCKANRKWQAHIQVNGRAKNLGYFNSPEDAYVVYREAAHKTFGSFARLEQ